MLKVLHDGNYDAYLRKQKEKLEVYLKHPKKREALRQLAERHYKALSERLKNIKTKGKRTLCLASRIGQEVKAFRDSGAFAIGIDLNPGPENEYVHYGDFHNIPFPDRSADIIYTNSIDHTFDLNKLIDEICRVIKIKGVFILEIQEGEEEGVLPEQWEAFWWGSVNEVIDRFIVAGFYKVNQYQIAQPFLAQHIVFTLDDNYGG